MCSHSPVSKFFTHWKSPFFLPLFLFPSGLFGSGFLSTAGGKMGPRGPVATFINLYWGSWGLETGVLGFAAGVRGEVPAGVWGMLFDVGRSIGVVSLMTIAGGALLAGGLTWETRCNGGGELQWSHTCHGLTGGGMACGGKVAGMPGGGITPGGMGSWMGHIAGMPGGRPKGKLMGGGVIKGGTAAAGPFWYGGGTKHCACWWVCWAAGDPRGATGCAL